MLIVYMLINYLHLIAFSSLKQSHYIKPWLTSRQQEELEVEPGEELQVLVRNLDMDHLLKVLLPEVMEPEPEVEEDLLAFDTWSPSLVLFQRRLELEVKLSASWPTTSSLRPLLEVLSMTIEWI